MLFHRDKNVLAIATKQETAKNIVTKIRFAYQALPNWLKIKTIEDNRLSLRLDNGSQVKAVAASPDAGRSEAVSLLILDEAAFIDNIDVIFTAAQQTLATGGQCIALSTPNGTGNWFHQTFTKAEMGENKFIPLRLPWTVHPERNQAWRDEQDIILGLRNAAQECDCDFSIEVSTADLTTAGSFKNPDFFIDFTGYIPGTRNTKNFVFFQRLVDANLLARYEMIPSTDVVYGYGTQADIAIIKYEYPVGQIYYAVLESKFYKSVNDTTSANIVNLELQTDFLVKTGRQGLYFQYKHISGETTRIDPATSNIIDLYVLTQSYYTQYTNWIQDTTGSITEPARPTINELTQTYSNINEYKMLTDSVIINSARFKPLFGSKAAPQLRATIKVIKSTTTTASDSEIITAVLTEINSYFNIDNWDFGDTFYFSELSAYLHSSIGDLVNSVVLVPTDPTLSFGELYEIHSAPYEIFTSAAQSSDISVISALTPSELTPTA